MTHSTVRAVIDVCPSTPNQELTKETIQDGIDMPTKLYDIEWDDKGYGITITKVTVERPDTDGGVEVPRRKLAMLDAVRSATVVSVRRL